MTEVIVEKRPNVIIEMGVWKGGSTITMANKLKELQIDGVVIAVDTWLGAWDRSSIERRALFLKWVSKINLISF